MMNIAENMLALSGNTPLVRINKLNKTAAIVTVKVESRNPGGSVKDRVGMAMIAEAEDRGLLSPGGLIVEPTSGNTGIGLALAAAVKGYQLILTMPETMSIERRKLLAAYGAQIVLTPGADGMKGAIDAANKIVAENPGAFMPQQFENPANPAIHRTTTAMEILQDTDGKVAAFVAGIGTGGTITGVGEALKEHNPAIKIYGVEPAASPLLTKGQAGPHPLQGIGANFVPKVLNAKILDKVIPVSGDQAFEIARRAAKEEGILMGISGGAALYAALQIAEQPEFAGKIIVVLLPDSGERYLSGTLFEA